MGSTIFNYRIFKARKVRSKRSCWLLC